MSSADGDVDDLAALVAARLKPPARLALSRRRGTRRRSRRRAAGEEFRTWIRSWSIARGRGGTLPAEAAAALAAGIDGVLHYSRRSAEAFVSAARKPALLEAALGKPVHFCLSARVAEPLQEAGAADVRIAARPDEAALMSLCG